MPGPFFAWLMSTSLGILLFLLLVRRRRPDEEEPSLATFVFETLVPVRSPIPSLVPAAQGGPVVPRSASPIPPEPARAPAKRRPAPRPAAEGRARKRVLERVYVSYRSVRMTSGADELSDEVARLQRGDELEVIGSEEGFLNVRTKAGEVGWIRRGTVSGNPPPAAPSAPAK